ncbi:amidohydrolase [Ponticaulis sp.]|uniref:amidohydrolase n=1 Tax=Ponticaulis sp. TaxID=2020902 RepID=UPI000B6E1FEC|nr:amidohydrolase [Ponticaulis sp.]MAJ09380.1 amidohydrolase [Ponticaulis sp.]RPG18731.1 MAG: amidohydrolase [Hyphomonadaceae bacterium TMED125]HBH88997.1 amidohydrolase [Hyphomonadaceae bacterium]HBJ93145.1 amidohydrolase [Hyphomonadaceae bacterium]|tara:strand:- start:11049 stop:12701 length:1653 start_codon:yes stop_codon:yes gene_type:complete
MRRAILLSTSLVLLAACNREVPIRADVIYTGGTIYTGVEAGETVEAVAVGDGLIVYTGPMDGAITSASTGANIVRLPDDAVMFPGFTDSHVHLSGVGERELTLNLDQVRSVGELQAALTAYREANPGVDRIYGRGWIETHWPEGRFPMASDIDEVIADIPVVLTRADGHAAVANTAALNAADITPATEAPAGGEILYTDAGEPSGMLIDNAMDLVWGLFAAPTIEDMSRFVSTGYDVYASRGWTGLHNMSVGGLELEALTELAIDGTVPLRTYNAVVPEQFEAAANRSPTGDRMTTRAVKIYMDGALGSRGALLFQPYSDAPDTVGLALREEDETVEFFQRAVDSDVQLAIHAIGDLANHRALIWMEDVFGEEVPEHRWRVEHAQIVQDEDQLRFAELGTVASMQPSHAIGDLHFAPSRLGMARLGDAYAWQDLMDKGVVIAGGSDAPVEVGDPIIEFYAATVRRDLEGFATDGWHREQALSRFDALRIFTQNAAFAAFQEDELGTIEIGNLADFSVFNQDLMTIEDEEILATEPVMTIVGGEIVWQAAE